MRETLGARVRRLRNAAGLEATELAEQAGVTQSAISQIESGKIGMVKADTGILLARALGTTCEALLDPDQSLVRAESPRAKYRTHLSPGAVELAKWFDALDPEDQRKAIGVLMAYGPAVPNERVAKFLAPAPNNAPLHQIKP